MLALRLIGRSFDVVEGPTVFGVWEQPQAMNSQRFRARSALLYSPGCLPALVIFMNPRLFASRPTRKGLVYLPAAGWSRRNILDNGSDPSAGRHHTSFHFH